MVAILEFDYRGLVFGGGTDYSVTNIEGLSPPDAREDEIEKAVDHGSYIYSEFLEARRIVFEGFIAVADVETLETRIAAMKTAFRNQLTPQPLLLRLPGQAQKRCFCQPKRRHFTMDNDYANGYSEWAVELKAGDPRLYADTESSIAGNGDAVNEGDFSSHPLVTISGAAVNPTITNTTTGETLRILHTTVAADVLVVDFFEKTVMLNGSISKYGAVDPSASDFFDLEPGSNVISYAGGGAFEMRWRSAWY